MKKVFHHIVFLILLGLLGACGTTKNTKTRRLYHSLNSRYNIYFNGKTSFDEALDAMQKGYKESYTERILMYPVSALPKEKTTTGGPFDRAIEKGNKAIKLHSIQAKPAKKSGWRNNPKMVAFMEQEEYNPFLKFCWLIVGEGQFYNADFLQASATFSYIAKHYAHDEIMAADARLWQARCYSEMGWLYEAEDILGKLNTRGIPKESRDRYAAVYADYLIKNQQFAEAIPYLQTAVKTEKDKLQKNRMKYLLGQLYSGDGQNELAYRMFGAVAAASPPYELEFAARIRQTEVFPGANPRKMVGMLEGMAKSEKNKDYLDQIYYALGNIYMAGRDTVQAIKYYEKGVEMSTQNGMDKAILQIRLGDLYFGMKNYIKAQPCFSGAVGIIKKEYKDYERIATLSAVLDELVIHAEAIHLQDSLQKVARMPEAERLALIDKKIEQVIKDEKEAKKQAEKDAMMAEREGMGTGIDRPGMEIVTPTMPGASGGSGFYFYNPQMVSQGKAQFQRKWGRRPLEDDWRRKNKKVTTFDETAAALETPVAQRDKPLPADSANVAEADSIADNPKSREYYLQQLPSTEEEFEASNTIIIDGMYNIGLIYKDKLDDMSLSIEALEELEKRFPDNEHRQDCYYQIYLMALRMKDAGLAEKYKDKMMAEFPDDDHTIAISDPDYEYNMRSMDSIQTAVYDATYAAYLAEDTAAVHNNYNEISAKYPLADLLPKFMFLHALSYVQQDDAEGFKNTLKALIEKYPKADVTELAGEMLKGVLRGRELAQGSFKGMIWNMRFGGDGMLSAEDSARVFSAERNMPCRVIMMYPEGNIDRNSLLYIVAAYNFSNFLVKELDLTFEDAGGARMLSVSGFVHFDEAMQYYKMIYGSNGYASKLSSEIAIIPISDENYETLMRGKTLDEYLDFLEEAYGEAASILTARLRARIDVARKDEEKIEDAKYEPINEPAEIQTDEPELPTIISTIAPDNNPADTIAFADDIPVSPIKSDTIPAAIVLPDTATKSPAAVINPAEKTEKPKTPAQIRKEKEREYKKRQQEKENARKEKEKAYKMKQREKKKAARKK
ncbi:MAG: tetratricopeptide repeat protein [Tannerellaceae bacterium]|nr:tetratricopeptide repeat protein [Tannerellaceae bacterium]